ncbi:MAG: hypothetical protein ABIR35_08770 [Polaromonas sp.]
MVKALESMGSFYTGGITVSYSPVNRIGSRYVEVRISRQSPARPEWPICTEFLYAQKQRGAGFW